MVEKYTYDILKNAVYSSKSYSEVLRNLQASSGSYKHVKAMIRKHDISTSHFENNFGRDIRERDSNGRIKNKKVEDILVVIPDNKYSRMSRKQLMYAMMSSGIEYKCMMENCEQPEPIWRGKPCSLDIDHIDGNWRNCKLENLRFLCGRCHSQVETNTKSSAINPKDLDDLIFQMKQKNSRNRKKCLDCDSLILNSSIRCNKCQNKTKKNVLRIKYPPINEILKNLKTKSIRAYAKEFGISDNGLRKHLKRQGIIRINKAK